MPPQICIFDACSCSFCVVDLRPGRYGRNHYHDNHKDLFSITIYILISPHICEYMDYVVKFVYHNELTGYLKCDVKKTKQQLLLIFPKNISHFLRNFSKYVLVINLDKVNVYHNISVYDFITI